MPKRISILDTPNGDLRELIEAFRTVCGTERSIRIYKNSHDLLRSLASEQVCDLVVIDQQLGDGQESGISVLTQVRAKAPELPVIVVAEEGNVDAATIAIDAGATDFLVRRHRLEDRVSTQVRKIHRIIRLVDRNRALADQNRQLIEADLSRYHIVGSSPQLKSVIEAIDRVAAVPRPVLITGERGTGKELVARAIHMASGAQGPFIAVNCAAFADSLLESELFGHDRGAFTGADGRTPGKLELSAGGTLFLDEIGNMSMSFQRDLLRVVEYRSFVRVGGTAEVPFEGRIVAATNANLQTKIESGDFLPDLYDRLAFEVIRVPPLRERNGDIEGLAQHFLEQFMQEVPAFLGKDLSQEALGVLKEYTFPGNVRELKNIIERAVLRDTTNEINPEDIGLLSISPQQKNCEGGCFKTRVETYERKLIQEAIESANGNQAEAARILGLSYHQLRYYAQKYKA